MSDWCIAMTVSNKSMLVKERALFRYGIDLYIPMVRHQNLSRGRKKVLDEARPVFSGYVFVPCISGWESINELDGVLHFLTRSDEVVKIPNTLIEQVRHLEATGAYEEFGHTIKTYCVGAAVKVKSGAFATAVGTITRVINKKHVKVLFEKIEVQLPRKILELL